MKVTAKQIDFQPITLEIVIESKDELLEMYHRLNAAPIKVREGSPGSAPYPNYWCQGIPLYNFLEAEVNKL